MMKTITHESREIILTCFGVAWKHRAGVHSNTDFMQDEPDNFSDPVIEHVKPATQPTMEVT